MMANRFIKIIFKENLDEEKILQFDFKRDKRNALFKSKFNMIKLLRLYASSKLLDALTK